MIPGQVVRKVKEVSKALRETYVLYFNRGTEKFISKFAFKKEDLGKTYTIPEGDFKLTGQVNEKILLMEKEGIDYYVDTSYFHNERKRE